MAKGDIAMQTIAYASDKCIDNQLLVSNLVALFELRRLNLNHLLSGSGIFMEDLNTQHKISPIQLLKLIDNAQKIWRGDDLAFLLGQHWLPNQSGVMTNGLLCCRNLAQLQSYWQRHHWQSQPWLQGWLWKTESKQHLIFSLDIGTQTHQRFFIELTLSSLVSTYKRLRHETWQGEFSFPYPEPKNIDQYHKYLGNMLKFKQPLCAISFSPAQLKKEFVMANPQSYKLAYRQALSALNTSEYSIGLPSAIRLQMMQKDGQQASLPDISKRLNISPATLKRRLKEYHTSFQQLQDEANLHRALYMLAINRESNLAVAQQLKFADSNNFRRSFKRWTGQLPNQLRDWLVTINN